MAAAATEFLAALTPAQRAKAALPFELEGERTHWHYTPVARAGVPLIELGPQQRRLAHRLLSTGLSDGGYVTAATIIGLENVLLRNERFPAHPYRHYDGDSIGRDPLMYVAAVFGEPGGAAPWGWHFGGHHVSVNYTIAEGSLLAPTPTFFGADPADSEAVGAQVLRPLGAEEDLGRELLHLLDGEQQAVAILSPAAPLDIVQSNRPRIEDGAAPLPLWQLMSPMPENLAEALRRTTARYEAESGFGPAALEAVRYGATPKGLAATKMNAGQRAALIALIQQYIGRMPDEVAAFEHARLRAAGIEQVHFAWAGGIQRRQPHYYRLQGPRFLVEYDNVQNGANHIHAVWRDPEGDFGRDLLAEHYAAHH
ncbi:MAG: DUF3500 domain-containing protein [Chloroflexi bacterium]|nr:DUF3500 domain-containing protein [Chloroflexota bacterium]